MDKFDPKKDAEITRECYACKYGLPNRTLPQTLNEIVAAYCGVSSRQWTITYNRFTAMSTADDGKRYNVWFTPKNRWTNKSQDPSQPKSLTHKEAIDLLNDLTLGNPAAAPEFEIRELTAGNNVPVNNTPVIKSAGLNCAGTHCNEFNPYAEPNQANGSYLCYNCRKR